MNATGNGRRFLGLLALMLWGLAGCAGSTARTEDFALAGYDKVMIDPVSVSLQKNGLPGTTGTRLPPGEEEVQRIKRDIADIFNESFASELGRRGLMVVGSPGPGVLRITPELVDVRLNAPLEHATHSLRTYVRSVGDITLSVEFRDSRSGEALLTLYDTMQGRDLGLLRPASPVYTRIELARIFEDWAQVIREDILGAR